MDTAQKCVEQLKHHKIGTASFLALDRQEKWRDSLKRKLNALENVALLVDLIKVNNETFLNGFYFSLRNTLVSDSLEQASRIAYGQQRNRVVTLKGEVIEVSGTMSGGGRPSKGRMGTKLVEEITADSIKQMQFSLQNDEVELKEIIGRKQELEPKIYELKSKYDRNKENLIKWKQDVGSVKEQIMTLKKGGVECRRKMKELMPDEGKKKKLEENLEKFKQDYDKPEKVAATVPKDIDELHENIMNINNRILDKPKKNFEKIDDEIKESNNQVTSLDVEIKSSTRNISNSKKKIDSLTEDLDLNEDKAETFKKRLEEIDIEGKELIEEHEKVKEELEHLENEIGEKTKFKKDAEKEKQKYEKIKIDLNHKLDKIMQSLNNDERELKHFKQLIQSLKLHNVNFERAREINDERPELELKKYSNDELDNIDIDELKDELHEIEENLKNMTPNLAAIQNFLELVKINFSKKTFEIVLKYVLVDFKKKYLNFFFERVPPYDFTFSKKNLQKQSQTALNHVLLDLRRKK
jgi:structural maintenance of chromosome 4